MTEYVVLSAILFTIGAIGVLTRRNAIVVFMCVELMLNACNLAFVAFAHQHHHHGDVGEPFPFHDWSNSNTVRG